LNSQGGDSGGSQDGDFEVVIVVVWRRELGEWGREGYMSEWWL